jgi:hypothetical protein
MLNRRLPWAAPKTMADRESSSFRHDVDDRAPGHAGGQTPDDGLFPDTKKGRALLAKSARPS